MSGRWRWVLGVVFLAFFAMLPAVPAFGAFSITVLYDNAPYQEGVTPDWGFSCLIKTGRREILFDTGKDGGILVSNADRLGVDLKPIGRIIVSHLHQDHIGGLFSVLAVQPKAVVYLPETTPGLSQQLTAHGINRIIVDRPAQIDKGVFLTGAVGEGMKEQALLINTPLGLVVVAGCSHPGVLTIIKRAKDLLNRPIFLVIGGFHSMPGTVSGLSAAANQFKELGVRKVAPAHCTSEQTKAFFKAAYGKDYITVGAGKTLTFLTERKGRR